MTKLTTQELQQMVNLFGFKNLMNRYITMEKYFDIQEGDIVFDCGAFVGDSAIYLSRKVGSTGRVYSFEPLGLNMQSLMIFIMKQNLTNVKPIEIALSDKEGTIPLYLSEYSNAGSILPDFRKVTNQHIEVNSDTIDNIVRKYKIPKVDFLWSNIEGAEIDMLKGAKNTLMNNDCKLIISCHHIKDDIYTMPEVREILTDYSYECKCISKIPDRGWLYGTR